jgi:glycosyltransferase involved in cell wall biosynthesis
MRIGFDAKRAFQNFTGLGNYARDVLRLVHAYAPAAELFAYAPRAPDPRVVLPADRVHVRLPRTWAGGLVPAVWRQVAITGAAARDRVEVFHGLSAELPLGIERSRIPTVVTVHDLIYERLPELYAAVDRRVYRWKCRSAARHATLVAAISGRTAHDLVELYGVPASRVRVVYQGCHAAFQREIPEAAVAAARARHGLDAPYFLSVGTVERRKNLGAVVAALREIPEAGLAIVGRRTPYADEVDAAIAAAGLGRRVRWLSGVATDELAALYRGSLALVYPSFYEGFGIPIVEALCSGAPVVTSRGAPFDEAGGPGSAYVDPRNPGELAEVLRELAANGARREEMRRRGLAWAERFRDEAVARALLAVYDEARARAGA